jgi:MoaA/NifB/PqqE/SkfB family radical SAM enzyme
MTCDPQKRVCHAWDDPLRRWPTVAYVETSSTCNYRCLSCGNEHMRRFRGVMTYETFVGVADKVKQRGILIGAMFGCGEPLMDDGIFEKMRYARSIDVIQPGGYIGFNTNASLLTPDKYEPLLQLFPSVVFSVFNVGAAYDRLTGNGSWAKIYPRILDFIRYRDANRPEFNIFIGCNQVPGADMQAVRAAFAGYRVSFETDPHIDWENPERLTGPLLRNAQTGLLCDGMRGVLQVRPNGDCGFCAYDFFGTYDGRLETGIGNLLVNSWETLEANFRALWKQPSTVCARCDYYNSAK